MRLSRKNTTLRQIIAQADRKLNVISLASITRKYSLLYFLTREKYVIKKAVILYIK